MRTPSTISENVFPADGRWHRTDHWRARSRRTCPEEICVAAENALLTVFSESWCRSRPHSDHVCHRFEWWYSYGAGERRILELGYSLHLLGCPEPLVADLRNARDVLKFPTRAAEAWAGALLHCLGGAVEFIDSSTHDGRTPEATASWGSTALALEVKSLQVSQFRRGVMLFESHFSMGLHAAMMESSTNVSSWPEFKLPDETVSEICQRLADDEESTRDAAVVEARALGLDFGREWMSLLSPGLAPGRVLQSERVLVEIRDPARGGPPFMLSPTFEPAQVTWRALSKQLNSATAQVSAGGVPGVAVVDNMFGQWSYTTINRLVQAANDSRPRPWADAFGAVLLRVTTAAGSPGAWVVPVAARWNELPDPVRTFGVPTSEGLRFLPFDVLRVPLA